MDPQLYSSYGFEFTDEGFYLASIKNPFLYDYSHTKFSFVYHPIYILLNGDITALRRTNILFTVGLNWCLTYRYLTFLAPEARKDSITLHIVAAGLATCALCIFDLWLPTPNYNSLTLQALLITALGLLFIEKIIGFKSAASWITIGFGGWLAFMAKPSTALALAISILLYLLITRKFSIRGIFLATTTAIFFLLH